MGASESALKPYQKHVLLVHGRCMKENTNYFQDSLGLKLPARRDKSTDTIQVYGCRVEGLGFRA